MDNFLSSVSHAVGTDDIEAAFDKDLFAYVDVGPFKSDHKRHFDADLFGSRDYAGGTQCGAAVRPGTRDSA